LDRDRYRSQSSDLGTPAHALLRGTRGPLAADDLGRTRRGRRVAAATDGDAPVDQYHRDARQVAGGERAERVRGDRADRRVADDEVRCAPGRDHAAVEPIDV